MTASISDFSVRHRHDCFLSLGSYIEPMPERAPSNYDDTVHTCLQALEVVSVSRVSRAVLQDFVQHPDPLVRYLTFLHRSSDQSLRMRFIDDAEWLLRTLAVEWVPGLPIEKIVEALGGDAPMMRERVGPIVRARAQDLLSAPPAIVATALKELPASVWFPRSRWAVQPEVMLDRLDQEAKCTVLAHWCTSSEARVARRALRTTERWIQFGHTVPGRRASATSKAQRIGAIAVALVECLASSDLAQEARGHGMEVLGRLGSNTTG